MHTIRALSEYHPEPRHFRYMYDSYVAMEEHQHIDMVGAW